MSAPSDHSQGDSITVGELVALFLEAVGIDAAFGVISIHNMPMLDPLQRRNAIRFVPSRGEAGGAHMADAYARVRGGLGAVITSTGPGAANAVGGLLEARVAGTPVLHLTGQTESRYIDSGAGTIHDAPAQMQMLLSVSKAAYRIATPESALATLIRAATDALTPPMGPVSIEIPVDVQRQRIPRPQGLDRLTLPLPPPMPPDADAIDRLAVMVIKAKRVLVWAGNGALHAGPQLERLARIGIGIVTSMHGRAMVAEDHSMTLGAFNGNMTPAVEQFYGTVDLMVVAGSRLRGHETRDFRVPLPARRARIDIDPLAQDRGYAAEMFVCADTALALDALADRLEGRFASDPTFATDLKRARATAARELHEALGVYGELCATLRDLTPRDAVWVRDITLCNSTWGNRLFPVYGPHDNVYSTNAGIGMGLSFGIGASIGASGRKVVTLSGDGGFVVNLGELWTAAQEQANVVFIVMNDGGYGVIRNIQDAQYQGRRGNTDLAMPDYAKLAQSAGIAFWRAGTLDAFGTAAAEAMAHKGPALIEVDMAELGPFPTQFAGPPPPAAKA
jgi:acetolactate synthase-1/2/3 large subunit